MERALGGKGGNSFLRAEKKGKSQMIMIYCDRG